MEIKENSFQYLRSFSIITEFGWINIMSKTMKTILIPSSIMALLIGFAVHANAAEPTTASEYFKRALSRSNGDNHSGAVADYTEVISMLPDHRNTYFNRANSYRKLKQHDKAISDYEKVLSIKPDPNKANDVKPKDVYRNRALSWRALAARSYNNKDFDKAEEYREKAIADYSSFIEIDPNVADIYYFRAALLKGKRAYDSAIDDYTEVLKKKPKDYESYFSRGNCWRSSGNQERAISDYSKVIEIAPRYSFAIAMRGYSYILNEQYDEAIQDLTKAIEMNPKDRISYGNRGDAYLAKLDYKNAVKDLEKANRIDNRWPFQHLTLGKAYYGMGDHKKSVDCFSKVIDLDANNRYTSVFKLRSEAYRHMGDFNSSMRDLIKAKQYDPSIEVVRKVALLVGVNVYEKRGLANSPLNFAERDIDKMAEQLLKNHFEVTILKGSSHGESKATSKNIYAALTKILKGINADDIVLVGFAGHGMQLPLLDKNGKSITDRSGRPLEDAYFCPVDARKTDPDTLISLTKLVERLENEGGINLVMVDACRDNPDPGRSARSISGNELNGRLPANTAIVFSCSAGQQALETKDAGGGHGVFFYHVLKGLKGDAANRKGKVTWNGLISYVQENVNDKASEWFPDRAKFAPNKMLQTPHELRNLVRVPVLVGN